MEDILLWHFQSYDGSADGVLSNLIGRRDDLHRKTQEDLKKKRLVVCIKAEAIETDWM